MKLKAMLKFFLVVQLKPLEKKKKKRKKGHEQNCLTLPKIRWWDATLLSHLEHSKYHLIKMTQGIAF